MDTFQLDYSSIDKPLEVVTRADKNLASAINESMSEFAPNLIQRNIVSVLPSSGRSWKGKSAPASSTDPFRHEPIKLGTLVKTKSEYNYLYFPDDGSNTKRHQGNQQFMHRGAEMSQDEIIEDITKRFLES